MAKKKQKPATEEPQTIAEQVEETPGEEKAGAEVETTDPLQELKKEIEDAKQEASKNWDLYLRERADLENARKRHQRDREEAIRFANDRLLKEMIPVLDNLERVYRGIDVIYPPDDFRVDRLTNDQEKILEGFEQGVYAGIAFLKGKKSALA